MTDLEFNVEQMLQSDRAWEFILLDIVKSEDLDPWDIDITKLTQKYLDRVNNMKQLDLRVPARLILAAAILLKMKSDCLLFESNTPDFEEGFGEGFEDEDLFGQPDAEREVMDDVPDLNINVRRKHIRKITLGDLIDKLKNSMEPPKPRGRAFKKFRLELPEEDISQQLEALYKEIINHNLQKIPFSKLTKEKNRRGIIETFLPLLHLANEHKIDLHQDEFFKEIFVEHVPEEERNRRLNLKAVETPEEKEEKSQTSG
ncbi:MAG: segregation/condensation protein A [archaeon]